ncbi:hypothetical protein HK105_205804 [Polyrhizophydium stewartii]|uniref:Carboxylesterase type B domain-containing protein n=1 Tax=Polyrhizophydium stewartii TaxID=2732419 RepID=A0ABR4N586_9FUNG
MFRGIASKNLAVTSFLNIPYAAPPVGILRFRPPQPPAAISGVYDATRMGNSCMQATAPQFFGGANQRNSEDCLNLNVFAPTEAVIAGTLSRLPVVVFIYGGGFNTGYNNMPVFDGVSLINAMPATGKAIVVVPNYRTNAFGFLASSELQAEGSLNAGLLDQAAAFKWVRDNIRRFGGDPARVTAWGQSAGAISIATHMVSGNANRQLFDRAILHSGALLPFAATPATQQASFNALAAALGCSAATRPVLECLRAVPAQTLLGTATRLGIRYLPAVDGKYVTAQPQQLLAQGQVAKIPTILLDNTDEGTLFTATANVTDSASAAAFERANLPHLGGSGFTALQRLYPTESSTPVATASEAYGDAAFRCPERQLARSLTAAGVGVFKGRFNVQRSVFLPGSESFLKPLGVFHSAELPYVWSHAPQLSTGNGDLAVSRTMISAWADFVSGRTPATTAKISWPEFGASQQRLVWQAGGAVAAESLSPDFDSKCDFWDGAAAGFSKLLA